MLHLTLDKYGENVLIYILKYKYYLRRKTGHYEGYTGTVWKHGL